MFNRNRNLVFALLALMFALAVPRQAKATTTVLDFEGLQNLESILNFYDGGAGSLGSVGPDYNITFGSDALALIDADAGGSGNFANEPSPDTIAFFLSGPGVVMNVLNGFTTGFSFWYTSYPAGSVNVYDALDGGGNLLATVAFAGNYNLNCTGDPSGDFCHWDPVGVAFGGTAYSVSFLGSVNQTGFDNITMGSETPGGVIPEPASVLLLGSGLAGIAGVLRKRANRKN